MEFSPLFGLFVLAGNLLLGYFVFLQGGKGRRLTEESFKFKLFKGKVGTILVILYIVGVVSSIIFFAYRIRQFHI